MAESITFDVLARDRASQTFNKIGQSTANLESRFAKFSATATKVASVLVGAQIGRSVLAAADAFELSRSRLETITTNIGASFDGLSKQVDAVDAKMEKFGFTNAETEGALASLVAVTKNPTKALTDLALAADIARGRNIGLSEAVLILSRVETGHVAMLSKLGIATKDAAGHTLTQVQALQMLANLYSGSAARASDTFAGKQAALRAAIQDDAAKIGTALLPAAVDLAKVLQQDLLPPIVAVAHWLDRNRQTVEPLAKALLVGAAAMKAYSLATKAAAAANVLFGASGAAAAGGATAGVAGGAAGEVGAVGAVGATGRLAQVGAAAKGVPLAGALGYLSYTLTSNTLNDFFPKTLKPTTQLAGATAGLVKQYGSLDKALAALKAHNAETQASQEALIRSWDQSASAVHRTAAALVAAAQKNVALSSAQDGLRQAFQQAAQTAADNGRALAGNSDAALANRDALRHEADALFAVIDAMKAHGATAAAQATTLSILEQALEINATKTYGDKAAVDALLGSLGLIPDAVNLAANALATLPTIAQNQITDGAISPGAIHQLNLAVAGAKEQAKTQGKKLADSFIAGYTPVVAKGAAKAASTASNAAAKAFDTMRQRMQTDLASIKDLLTSTTTSLEDFANISNNAGRTDTLGASGGPAGILSYKKQQAQRLEQFARLFTQLDRLGLNAQDLREFVQAGPAAIPAMQELLRAGRRGIRQENALQRRIDAAAARVGREETALQDAGLIHRDLQVLPKKLADAFTKDLEKLHIITDRGKLDSRNGAKIVATP